jgi:hypothetical protein
VAGPVPHRPGRDGQAIRDALVGGGGWTAMLELFAKAAANQQ